MCVDAKYWKEVAVGSYRITHTQKRDFFFNAVPGGRITMTLMSWAKWCQAGQRGQAERSVQGGIYALGKAHMCCTPSQNFLQCCL